MVSQSHDYRPDHSGWGRSSCRRCGTRWRPRMADFWDAMWQYSQDNGATWIDANGLPVPPCEPTEGSRMHLLPPSPERQNLRSATPMGFARAFCAANR